MAQMRNTQGNGRDVLADEELGNGAGSAGTGIDGSRRGVDCRCRAAGRGLRDRLGEYGEGRAGVDGDDRFRDGCQDRPARLLRPDGFRYSGRDDGPPGRVLGPVRSQFCASPSQTGIPVAGGAVIEIDITASVDDSQYHVRLADPLPGLDLGGYRTFRDAKFGGYYDGATHIGLGVRATLPFRVMVLPDRLVVDVAHSW